MSIAHDRYHYINLTISPNMQAYVERWIRQNCPRPLCFPQSLLNVLVERRWLTTYQSEQIMAGNGEKLVLGPYRLLEMIGEGGMGQVFKAKHTRLNRLVALKIISPKRLSQDPEAIHRFQREARAAAQLSHPNVAVIFDADQVADTHFIALETKTKVPDTFVFFIVSLFESSLSKLVRSFRAVFSGSFLGFVVIMICVQEATTLPRKLQVLLVSSFLATTHEVLRGRIRPGRNL